MATTVLYYLQNVWPFSTLKHDDLRVSDDLVKKLSIPDHTKQFVFAIREPESQAVIYILCAQNLSESSSLDAEYLIRNVKPGAVVAQVTESQSQEIESFGSGADEKSVPTSSFQVVKRCFLDKINKEKYEDVAGGLVLREIFGVGFHDHFLAAKKMAEEVGSSFLLLGSPCVPLHGKGVSPSGEAHPGSNFQALALQPNSLVPQKMGSVSPSSSLTSPIVSNLNSKLLRSLALHLSQSSSTPGIDSKEVHPLADYEPPQFAQSVYPLLVDLHDIFQDVPSIGKALAYAQKMLFDVNKGETVSTELVSEVSIFRIAVEGLRIALNSAGRLPISRVKNGHSDNMEFYDLPDEDKSHALLAHALQSQAKNFKSMVVVVDTSALAGLRKHWRTPIPPEVKGMVEELVTDFADGGEASNRDNKKRSLTNKPAVAVGAGATAVLGATSLTKVVPTSTFMKVVTFKIPTSLNIVRTQTQRAIAIAISKIVGSSKVVAPGVASSGLKTTSAMKATASAEKIRTVVHSVIASAEKTSLSAMRTAFYEIMRKRQVRPIGVLPFATFGCSVATCTGLLMYGDGIECAVESIPAAPSIASLGRGIQSLHQAYQAVKQSESSKLQQSIESLMYRFK